MSTFVIVKAQEDIYPDDQTRYQKGFIVEILGHDMLQGDTSGKYCQFEITDFDDYLTLKNYVSIWYPNVDWEFIEHNYVLDEHQLKIWMTNMSASGMNSLTRDKVEMELNRWNCLIENDILNEVIFSTNIFNTICSPGFWCDKDVSGIIFSETNYNQTTGVHSISANYAAIPINPIEVEQIIIDRGGVITSHPTNTVKFDITREIVFEVLKKSVKEYVKRQIFSIRQFCIPETYIQTALDAGGNLQLTKNQFVTYVRNRLDD